jgi:type 1 glutamine amidotransferase
MSRIQSSRTNQRIRFGFPSNVSNIITCVPVRPLQFQPRQTLHTNIFWLGALATICLFFTTQRAFAEQPHIVFLIGEDEYKTNETLPKFAEATLEPAGYRCSFIFASQDDPNRFEKIELLDDADLLFISVRRRTPPQAQMEKIKAYCESGKPLIGIRTASHAFALREGQPPEGHADWPEFDRLVLGGNYHLHHGNKEGEDPKTFVWVEAQERDHPIAAELPAGEFETKNWLYKNQPLQSNTRLLMSGRVEGREPNEPVTWIHHYKGAKVFYTSMGTPEEFAGEVLPKLLLNAVKWSLDNSAAAEPDAKLEN